MNAAGPEPIVAQELPRAPRTMLLQALAVYGALLALLTLNDRSHLLDWAAPLPIPLQLALRVALPLVVALGGTWIFVRREPDPRGALALSPLPVESALTYGALGFLFAYLGNATLGGFYLLATRTNVTELLSHRGPMLELLSKTPLWMVLPLSMVVGFYEELVFRGFVLGRLRHALRPVASTARHADVLAVVLSAAMFGSLHGYQGWYGVFQTMGAGLGLGALAVWRRSIWPSIVAHAAVDAVGLFALHVLLPALHRLLEHPPH